MAKVHTIMTAAPPVSLAKHINRIAAVNNIPLSVLIEVTRRCNLRCYYCYQRYQPPSHELSADQWDQVFAQLAEAGTLYLTISGGEPFVRSDIIPIIASARAKGFAVSIITNGTAIMPPVARTLAELGVMDVGISFLAAHPRMHDRLCGVGGSWARALSALRMLKKAGVNVLIKHSVSSRSLGEYAPLVRFAEKEGCLFECDSIILPQAPLSVSPFALSENGYRGFLAETTTSSSSLCHFDERSTDNLHCDAGRSLCGIFPNGDVVPCILLPLRMGNLRQRSFDRIWRGPSFRRFRDQERRLNSDCSACYNRRGCARCHGIAWYETGNWRGKSPSLCMRAAVAQFSST